MDAGRARPTRTTGRPRSHAARDAPNTPWTRRWPSATTSGSIVGRAAPEIPSSTTVPPRRASRTAVSAPAGSSPSKTNRTVEEAAGTGLLEADEGRIRDHEAARRRRRPHPAADARNAGAGADCRVRAPSETGSERLPGEDRQPQAESVHDDRVDRRRLRRAAQQPALPRRGWRPIASATSWASRAIRRSTRRCSSDSST